MKKNILLCIMALSIISSHAFSSIAGNPKSKNKSYWLSEKRNDGGEKCFDENTHIINFGVGFGRSYAYLYNAAGASAGTTPAFSVTYEQPWPKKLGPGFLGVGAYFGYQHTYYNYNYYYFYNNGAYYYDHSWNYFMVAGRAAYHWDVLNSKNAEVYAGVLIGLRFQTYTYSTNDPGNSDPYKYNQSSVWPVYSVFAGARWYFVKNFGLFAELGYGISYATGGLSIKF
ncbi:MAG TPA: hypothetical protein VN026_01205 [Bacteroidia bacterium]|jgi:hypothetical protein|nr:hypothetical protein [Bacteroidia bacterium]